MFRLVPLCLLVLCMGCGDLCGNDLFKELPSPSQSLKAVVFRRNCGATTSFVTHVSIEGINGKSPSAGGNIFVADHDHGAVRTGPDGLVPLQVHWESDGRLVIAYPPKTRIFAQETTYRGVSIKYVELAATNPQNKP